MINSVWEKSGWKVKTTSTKKRRKFDCESEDDYDEEFEQYHSADEYVDNVILEKEKIEKISIDESKSDHFIVDDPDQKNEASETKNSRRKGSFVVVDDEWEMDMDCVPCYNRAFCALKEVAKHEYEKHFK